MKRFTMLAVIVLLGTASLAKAQPSADAPPAFWTKIAEQTVVNLQSPDSDIRQIALKNVIILATLHRDKLSFDDAVGSIIVLCDKGGQQQDLAMAALQAIGSRKSLAYLAKHTSDEPAYPAEIIAAVLKEHYAKKSTAML